MSESSETIDIGRAKLEDHIFEQEQAVKAEIKKIQELPDVHFLPGQEERVGIFPMFEDDPEIPVLARFSYGYNAPNMSAVFFDKAVLSDQEGKDLGTKNTQDFLAEQGFKGRVIQVLGKFIPTDKEIESGKFSPAEAQIEEVDLDTKKDQIFGNVVFTRDENVVLTIKPADCGVLVFSGKDNKGNNITGIIHVGRDAVIAGYVRQGLTYLRDVIGVDLSKLKIAGFPGASRKNYWISNQAERRATGISIYNLGEDNIDEVDKALTTDEERNAQKRYIDLLSAGEMQAVQAGVLPENIQVCRADTYEDAGKGRVYSRRYSDDHDGAHPGGNLVAVQLKKENQGRVGKSVLPEDAELTKILAKEAQRTVPPENLELHFPQYEIAMKIFEHYGIPTDIFVDPSLDIQQVVARGKQLLDQLVQKVEFNALSEDEIALFNSAYEYLSEEDNPQASDCIFVFGAKTPLRAEKAVELYKKGLGENVIVSGGNPFYQPDEEAGADRYRRILVENGVPQGQIISENRSITMPDNVRSSLNLLDNYGINPKSMILVNSPYAQRRGWSIMKKYLPDSVSLYRVNAGVDQEISKDHWYKQEKSLRVVLNEFIKMRAGEVSNTA